MKFGSVCSGIEAASVAWNPLGWEAAWLSEIEPFPCAVLKHHYPNVPNHGDMTLLPEKILSGEVEAPDLFCGGTPCQAFSVAGLRNSLDDARGNLSLTFVGIANAIDYVRSVRRDAPAIIFWENVPGVLNTKDNAFGCFLGALAGEDEAIIAPGEKWSNAGCVFGPQRTVAWRVLDAQYFGVAKRRRRVFVVASARDDINPAEILFEFEGVRRDTAPSREAGQSIAASPERGTASGKSTFGTLMANVGTKLWLGNQEALSGNYHVLEPVAIQGNLIGRDTGGPCGVGASEEGVMYTLNTVDQHAVSYGIRTANTGANGHGISPELAHTLDLAQGQAVAQPVYEMHGQDSRVRDVGDICTTVTSKWGTGGGNIPVTMMQMAVRRLTPVECERLQGFPDGYTNIPWRKASESPDGPRYKALGNSWAVPVVRWIGQRIQDQINAP